MAQTTTAVNACDVEIALDNDGGVLTDISGSTNRISLDFAVNRGEANTFEGDYPISKTCGKTCSGTMTVLWSTTGDEGWDLVKGWYHVYNGASRTLRIDVPSNAGGNDRIQGEFLLEGYSFELASGEAGPILVEANIYGDGTINMLEIGT